MTDLSQFLIVFDHNRGALHQDITVLVDLAEAIDLPHNLPTCGWRRYACPTIRHVWA